MSVRYHELNVFDSPSMAHRVYPWIGRLFHDLSSSQLKTPCAARLNWIDFNWTQVLICRVQTARSGASVIAVFLGLRSRTEFRRDRTAVIPT